MGRKACSQLLIEHPLTGPLGRLTLAGKITHGKGTAFSNMRVLGSYAVVYLLAGSGRYVDANGVDQKLSAGDLITVYPDLAHAYGPSAGERWDEIYFVFDGPAFDLWRRQRLLNDGRPIVRLDMIQYWLARFEATVSSAANGSALITICHLQQLLAEVYEQGQTSGRSHADSAWLARAKMLLEAQPTFEKLDLERIADQTGISYVSFRKKFARLAGIPPAKYHMKSAMHRACDLIRQGSSNRQIAQRLGFCDEFHFSRRFKQIIGLSPRQFRLKVN